MDDLRALLARAGERAANLNLPYSGALSPQEAHALMQQLPEAKLIDVRTRAECEWVGRIPGAVMIEWNSWPSGQPNSQFLAQLQAQIPKSEAPMLFICRSGARSHNAAMAATQAGYPNCYNVLEGFEGDKDAQGHRNTIGGWRVAGLPWVQS